MMDRFTEAGQRVRITRWGDGGNTGTVDRIHLHGAAATVVIDRSDGVHKTEMVWAHQCARLLVYDEQTRNSPQSGHSSMSSTPVSGL